MKEKFIKDLVSVITPCYNTGKYIHRLLDSILNQTYPKIEMFAIDDGSTDDTKSIISNYIPLFEARGYTLTYVYQENSGQSVAIQKGLDLINGEYLVWPDSDDFYASEESLQKMVERFKQLTSEFAMVRTQEILISDEKDSRILRLQGEKVKEIEKKTLFEDCLLGQHGFYYCPGAYMIKTECLFESTKMPIYTSKRAGQNWQLMLPILYNYRCSSIKEPLYKVIERVGSHSREYNNYEQIKSRIEIYEETILQTLRNIRNIPESELNKYVLRVKKKYALELLNLSMDFKNEEDSIYYYGCLKKLRGNTLLTNIRFFCFSKNYHKINHYLKAVQCRLHK